MLNSGALFSPDRIYRYKLWRIWNPNKKPAFFICCNGSTADEFMDDPTVGRMMGFAGKWGFGGLVVGNVSAYRSQDPQKLIKMTDT